MEFAVSCDTVPELEVERGAFVWIFEAFQLGSIGSFRVNVADDSSLD